MSDATEAPARRLAEAPDWLYLLRELEAIYRDGSSGGSPAVRMHRGRVRDALGAAISAGPPLAERSAESRPVTTHLARALDLGEQGPLPGLARALRQVAPLVTWEHGYDRVPKALSRKYAYCEVLGPRGPVVVDRLILGFVLFAPQTIYPRHGHDELEESYVSVAGSWSENDSAVYAPGSLILNRIGDETRISTGRLDPCLLAYARTGPVARLADPEAKPYPPRRPPDA